MLLRFLFLMKTLFNRQNIFLILLILMVVAGKLIPYKPHYNEIFNLNKFIDWGIAGIFLLYGLKLNLKEVVKDISNWKLHLLVQFGTFILFPLLVFFILSFGKGQYVVSTVGCGIFSGSFAVHGLFIGGNGFHCQRQYHFSHIQRLSFRVDRNCDDAFADELFSQPKC